MKIVIRFALFYIFIKMVFISRALESAEEEERVLEFQKLIFCNDAFQAEATQTVGSFPPEFDELILACVKKVYPEGKGKIEDLRNYFCKNEKQLPFVRCILESIHTFMQNATDQKLVEFNNYKTKVMNIIPKFWKEKTEN